jgi:hypothetical protein
MKTKKYAYILFLITSFASAQVAIGKQSISSNAVSLEFYDGADNAKAMILPWVTSETAVTGAVEGTIIYDTATKKVKYKKGTSWFDLSVDETGVVNTSSQNNITEKATAKVYIGANPQSDTTPGILVLGDKDKAMILPKVASPHLKIINPEPGTIAYDTVTKQLCVYNGTVWSFWKP